MTGVKHLNFPMHPHLPQPTTTPAAEENVDNATASSPSDDCYRYLTYDELESLDWRADPSLPIPQRRRVPDDGEGLSKSSDAEVDVNTGSHRYAEGVLVWVLMSKGKPKKKRANVASSLAGGAAVTMENQKSNLKLRGARKNRKTEKKQKRAEEEGSRPRICVDESPPKAAKADGVPAEVPEAAQSAGGGDRGELSTGGADRDEREDADVVSPSTFGHRGRSELFKRARVVSDDNGDEVEDRRVLVRYSKGATYRVRASNLIPVLEPAPPLPLLPPPPLVIVAPETHIYRRLSVVHATPGDTFLEIGCDYGVTVDRVRRALEEGGDVPRRTIDADTKDGANHPPLPKDDSTPTKERGALEPCLTCLGIDKSAESIDIATKRYPSSKFVAGDVFVKEEMDRIQGLCERTLVGGGPSVVAIDINGNREIEGVLRCIRVVMDQSWKHRVPRIIIVKSRFLYWHMKGQDEEKQVS